MNDQILLSKRETARLLSVSLRTVDNLIARRELAARRVGRRVLIPRRTLEEFARRDHHTRGGSESQSDQLPVPTKS
jgi:excisionase family DNA binding protein